MLTCAHTAWKSTSAPHFFSTSGKETVENLKISPGQLAPCPEKRIKRQQTVSSAGCKVLVPNACFLLASMSSYCRFRPIECSYSQSVSVSVPQDKIRGSATPCTHKNPDAEEDSCPIVISEIVNDWLLSLPKKRSQPDVNPSELTTGHEGPVHCSPIIQIEKSHRMFHNGRRPYPAPTHPQMTVRHGWLWCVS